MHITFSDDLTQMRIDPVPERQRTGKRVILRRNGKGQVQMVLVTPSVFGKSNLLTTSEISTDGTYTLTRDGKILRPGSN